MKNRRGEYLYFCSAEQDSLYALTLFRKKEKQGTLNVQETGLLLCMEQRAEDSWIYLMPAAVYAAANQKGARSWMNRQKQEKIDLWNEKGIAWMRRYPVFWSSLDGNSGATRFWQREFLSSWKRNPWTSLKKEKIRFAIFYREAGDFSGSVCSSATG